MRAPTLRGVAWAGLVLALLATELAAQERPQLRLRHGQGETALSVATSRGFAATPVTSLADAGWAMDRTAMGTLLSGPGGVKVEIRDGTPFVRWGDSLVQMADAPYFEGGVLFVPLQFFTDVLPWKLPGAYRFDAPAHLLVWSPASGAGDVATSAAATPAPRAAPSSAPRAETTPPAASETPPSERTTGTGQDATQDTAWTRQPVAERLGKPVVFIDAGHGGEDPGSMSRSGIKEKDVALGIALSMARELSANPGLEIVLIRDDDTYVPPWDRGAGATVAKGERHGVFVSIHANSVPARSSSAKGFETYFLSEARTDHERRVAAIENAPLGVTAQDEEAGGDLDFILRELKNLDQQHWSSLLAEMVQTEVDRIHPGPNRGVKQAPLAVLTNAIMPAVLVEIGYLSNPEEAQILNEKSFQENAGVAIAHAVNRFFQRYPPGSE